MHPRFYVLLIGIHCYEGVIVVLLLRCSVSFTLLQSCYAACIATLQSLCS